MCLAACPRCVGSVPAEAVILGNKDAPVLRRAVWRGQKGTSGAVLVLCAVPTDNQLIAPVYDAAPSLEKLQVRLLHLQYTLYNPKQGNIWELSGSALRLAIDLGYHHERDMSTTPPSGEVAVTLEKDMRRRLFWSYRLGNDNRAFCIDRNLSIALGRPPGIPDDWINVQPISALPDEDIVARETSRGRQHPNTAPEPSPHRQSCPFKLSALHHIQIRRLQSEIQDRLYRLPRQGSILGDPPSPEWFNETRLRLVSWRRSSPPPTAFCSATWCDLNYYITLTLLHRPSPMNSKPSKDALKLARQGASGVMRTYKDMIKADRINWRWLAMYQLFIAGIAYLNSLWQAAEQGWTIVPSYVEALLDMQLDRGEATLTTATTPGFTSLCSAFEMVSERIIRELTSKASWGQIFSRASSPSALATNGGDGARPDNPYGPHAADTGTDISGSRTGQGNGLPYPDSASWSGPLSSELGWRPTTFASDPSSSDLDDILGRPTSGVPDGWDSMRFGPGASYAGIGAMGGANSMMGDGAANGGNGAGGINDILAALGMGQEPQATFDSFFLHPLPDFPSDDWAV